MTWQDEIGPVEPAAPFARIVDVRVNADRALPVMLGIVVLLGCVSFSGQLVQHVLHVDFAGLNTWITYFDVQESGNVPAWLRCALLFVDALALWTLADDAKIRGDGWSRHWRLLAVAFAFFSLDEPMAIHQQVFVAIRTSLHVSDLFFFAWVLPAIVLAAILGLMYGRFLWAMPRPTSLGLCGAAALYVSGAACLSLLRSPAGPDTVLYSSLTTVGVALQMFAMVAVLATVGRYSGTDRTTAAYAARVSRTVPAHQRQMTQATEMIDVTERHEIAPVVLDDVTAVRPVPEATDGDPAVPPAATPHARAQADSPPPPPSGLASGASDASSNGLFERPQHAAHRSW